MSVYSERPAAVQEAISDLAARLDLNTQDVQVLSRQEVTWSDGSLGCPVPGMAYKQQLINGSRLLLEVQGREYAYHAGPSGSYRYCPHPQAPHAYHSEA